MSELYVVLLIQTLRRPDIYGDRGIKSCYGITGDKCIPARSYIPLYNQHKTSASIPTNTAHLTWGAMNIHCAISQCGSGKILLQKLFFSFFEIAVRSTLIPKLNRNVT